MNGRLEGVFSWGFNSSLYCMKRGAELTAKSNSLFKKAISKRKRGIKILSIGTTFLVCGSFYLYSYYNNSPKNLGFTLKSSAVVEKLTGKIFPVVYAKTQTKKTTASICNPTFIEKNSREAQIEIAPSFCENEVFLTDDELLLKDMQEDKVQNKQEEELRKELLEILEGTPMEEMIDPILEQDRTVAAFLVGIAFKESKFGEYSPKKNGKDCYNYWGFKGKTNPTKSGYSCFSGPEEAIEIVGKRLKKLSIDAGRTKPSQLTVWKCGSSCATHSSASVQKWIADVSIFYNKIESLKI